MVYWYHIVETEKRAMLFLSGCKYCGIEIQQQRTGRTRLFCSRLCRQRYWTAENKDKLAEKRSKATCKYCGEIFFFSGCSKRKYCCREHYVAARYNIEPSNSKFPASDDAEPNLTAQAALPVLCIKSFNHPEPIIVDPDKLTHTNLPDDLSLNRVFLVCGFPNFKGKFDHFAGRVPQMSGLNLMNGDAFAFCNRAKTQVSILQWQGDGFALYFKRAEYGNFSWSAAAPSQVIEITPDDLKMLLEYPRLLLRLSGVSTSRISV